MILGISASWALMGTRMAVSFLLMPLFYRYLPKELLGVWLLFASLGAIFAVSDLGLATVTARSLAWYQGQRSNKKTGDKKSAGVLRMTLPQDLIATVSRAYLALGACVLLLAGVFGYFYLGTLSLADPSLADARLAWTTYALGLAVVLAASTPNYVLQGLGDVGLEAIAQTVALWVGLFAQWQWLRGGGSLSGLALIFLIQALATRALLWALLRQRHAWLFKAPGHFSWGLLKGLLGQSGGLFISSLCGLLIYQINPVLIVSLLGSAALPDYGALVVLVATGMQLASAVPQALMPFATQRGAAGDAEGLRRMHRLSLKVSLSLQLAYTAVLLVGAPLWVGLWLGQGHFAGYPVLGLLCVFYLLEHHHVANATFTISTGRWPFAPWTFAGGVLNTCFVYVGLRHFGLVGAAGGSVLAQLLTNNWYTVWFTLRRLGVSVRGYVKQVMVPLATLGGATMALIFVWRQNVGPWPALEGGLRSQLFSELAPAAVGSVFLILFVGLAAWSFVLDSQERKVFVGRLGNFIASFRKG